MKSGVRNKESGIAFCVILAVALGFSGASAQTSSKWAGDWNFGENGKERLVVCQQEGSRLTCVVPKGLSCRGEGEKLLEVTIDGNRISGVFHACEGGGRRSGSGKGKLHVAPRELKGEIEEDGKSIKFEYITTKGTKIRMLKRK